MKNALTIDLEDHSHATAFSAHGGPRGADSYFSRVKDNASRILEILEQVGCSATFFVVGSIAERFPGLIQRIASAGHEIACHSYAHRETFTFSRDQFYEDTRRAKTVIEDATGGRVLGYRAPSFSFTRHTPWAFEVLAELGFSYDSSIFPIKHLSFEMHRAPNKPFVITTSFGSILEFPMTTLQILDVRAPLAGGAYFRFLPYWYTHWGIRYLNSSERRPACVYLHPWELDAEQPRMNGSLTAKMRHYFGLRTAERKFRRLLEDFDFEPLSLLIQELDGEISSYEIKDVFGIHPAEPCGELTEFTYPRLRQR